MMFIIKPENSQNLTCFARVLYYNAFEDGSFSNKYRLYCHLCFGLILTKYSLV